MTSSKRSRESAQSQNPRPHDLAVVIKLDRVTAPQQSRSEKRLQAILQALETLLDGRPFADITIPDIAERSGCGAASIYARFKDKRSILVALHESLRDRQIAEIDAITSVTRHQRLPLEQTVLSICRNVVDYYSENRNLLRASYLLDDVEIYDRHAAVIEYASQRLEILLRPKLDAGHLSRTAAKQRVDLATRAIFALMQQNMIFAVIKAETTPAQKRALAAELALLAGLVLGKKD